MERILPLRKKIDEIDEQILNSLKERIEICKTIGAIKRKYNIPIKDQSRERKIFKSINERTTQLGLNPDQIEMVYREIITMCISIQESAAKT